MEWMKNRFVWILAAVVGTVVIVALFTGGGGRRARAEHGDANLTIVASTFMLNVRLNEGEVNEYLNEYINPSLAETGLPTLESFYGLGIMNFHDGIYRDDAGGLITGENGGHNLSCVPMLLVRDTLGKPGMIGTSHFYSNQGIIDHLEIRKVGYPGEASNITRKIQVNETGLEDRDRVHTVWKISDDRGSISFSANFFAPEMGAATTKALYVGDMGWFWRFNKAPERVYKILINRAFEDFDGDDVVAANVALSLNIDIENADPKKGLYLFDGKNATNVSRLRWVPAQILAFEEQ